MNKITRKIKFYNKNHEKKQIFLKLKIKKVKINKGLKSFKSKKNK